MKQTMAFVVVFLCSLAFGAAAESVTEGSDTNMLRNHSDSADTSDGSSPSAENSRARILEIARSVKPGSLPLAMIDAIIQRESNYRSHVRGARGEVGLMQILPSTARSIARDHGMTAIADLDHADLVAYLSEPRNNLRIGLAYLYWCFNRAEQDIGATIGCYNAGPANMWRWESISITRSYVRHVREHMAREGSAGS